MCPRLYLRAFFWTLAFFAFAGKSAAVLLGASAYLSNETLHASAPLTFSSLSSPARPAEIPSGQG
eukprot:1562358-Pyramimonas_sp.AAC.1